MSSSTTGSGSSVSTALSPGLVCRRPISQPSAITTGLKQALELQEPRSQGPLFWSPSKSPSTVCKCKAITRAGRARRLNLNLNFNLIRDPIFPPVIGEQGDGGGRRSSSSPSPPRTRTGIIRGRMVGRSIEVELVPCGDQPGTSSPALDEKSSTGSHDPDQELRELEPIKGARTGLVVVAPDDSGSITPIVRMAIGNVPKYIRLLPGQSPVEQRAADPALITFSPPQRCREPPPWDLSFPHVVIATIASVLFGYHIGVINVPLEYISQDLGFAGSTMSQGLLVSLLLGGAFVGCSASGLIADGFGRRRAFQLSSLPMIVGAVLCAISSTLKMMLCGRFLVGIGLGLSGPLASLYVSEISPTAVRGAYGSLLQVAGCCGILGALVAGFPSSTIPGWWRVCFWISTGPAVLLAAAMQFCAESPRWLFKKRQYDKAQTSLERLWGSRHVKEAMSDLLLKEQLESGRVRSWCDLFDRRYSKVVLIGAVLFALQQLAGINAVFYFSSTVFRSAGITSDVYASICVGIANLIASLLATFLMDREGRKSLLLISFSGMGVAMAIQASASAFPVLAPMQGSLAVVATLMYVVMFALGAGPVPGLLLPELFADCIRAKAMAVTMCVHWVVNFMVGLTFLQLLHKLGPSVVYSFFAAVCVLAVAFVSQVIFETRGKTLDEIQALLLSQQ